VSYTRLGIAAPATGMGPTQGADRSDLTGARPA
jgi:hypothetical protein